MINTNMMKYSLLSFAIIFFGSSTAVADSDLSNTTTSEANQQIVSVSQSSVGSVGGSVQIDITYSTSNQDNTTTGLGFRLHYNSNLMEISAVNSLLQKDLLVDVTGPLEDNQDQDNDASTDQYYSVGWASLNGDWPNEALPANVLSLQITIDSEIEIDQIDSIPINFSATALASGYQFLPQNHNLELTDSTWDFDGSCEADALTDGLILLRAGFDLRGEYLISNVMHPDATLTASEVEARIEKAVSITDIDSNGGFDALTDGLLLLRYLFDFKDQNLVSDVLSQTATRTSGDAIAQYIEQYMPNCINDTTPPVIISADTAIAIDENSGAGQLVYTAMAIDTDFNGAEYITFNLINEDLGFSIDNATGDVTTNADFAADYEDTELQSFTVVATDAAGNASEQFVSVAINNLDEVAPSITSGDTATAVDENSGADQVVYTATADDSADISAGVTFSLAGIDAAAFTIDASSGAVTLTDDPNYETQPSYSFTVIANDGVTTPAEQAVTLDINDVDEQAPVIDQLAVDATLSVEENIVDQVVHTVTATDDSNAAITFALTDSSDPGFSINSVTGEVRLNSSPNFEVKTSYSFEVVAFDQAGNTSTPQQFTVSVNNSDEIAPIITSDATAVAIDENTGAGTVIYTATADDSLDISAGVTFSLSSGSDAALSIDSSTGKVTLSADPDHETQSQYSFTVIASDGVNADVEQAVTLDINDLDDAAPTITSGDTAITIDENSGPEQVVYTATADDSADDVSDTPITFSLSSDSDVALSIDSATGEVTLSTDPDHETQSEYSFAVIATDAAGNESEAQSVILEINDLDDAAPTITSGDTAITIDENSGSNQIVYTATADDSGDDVADTPITFSLSSNSDVALSIDSATGEVTLSTDPDHETQSEYSFAVIATDAAGNESNAQSVTLSINDLDDAAPTITSTNTATAINENSGSGQVIYTATADDSGDDVADTPITFSLSSDSDTALSIDSATGEVTLSTDPDHETQSEYSFAVIATDAAGNESEAQSVILEINDLDDAAPTITSGDTAITIDENSGPEQVVYTATADDSGDDVSDTPITFTLAEGSDTALSIDSLTGAVTLSTDPDYEAQSQYSFTVVASDGVNADVEQLVTLDINNLDEIAPTLTSGDTAVAIDENTGADTVIYTATADDSLDISVGVTFSLTDDSDPALSIDPATGEVVLADDPDYETQNQYNYAVIAIDGAGNSSEAQSVTLEINDLNDTGPTITSGDTATAIDENSGSAQLIYTATAYDPSDTELPVSLVTIPELAEATQHVYVSSSSKSEDGSQETIVISYNADDSTTTGLGIRVHFDSSVIALADISIIFRNDLLVDSMQLDTDDFDNDANTDLYIEKGWASLFGSWPGTTPVNLVSVTFDVFVTLEDDPDSTAINFSSLSTAAGFTFAGQTHNLAITNPPMTFSLSADSDPAISIDSSTGDVFLNNDPDYEAQSQYNFAVIATNPQGVESEAQPVALDINNLDEISPIFISASAAVIDENFGFNKVVYTAIAHDSEDISGGVTFSLSDDDYEFTISASSGEVRLMDNPDFEAHTQYYFTVIANDGVNASVEQQVMLEINNINDESPIFDPAGRDIWVNENSGPNQFVFQVEAIDPDSYNNDFLTYSLSGTDAYALNIDPIVGYVSLIPSPDYETQTQYNFAVIANDGVNTSESLPYTLYINNLDEVAPSITSGDTAVAIYENTGADTVIYTATADDSLDISAGVTFSLTGDSDPALSIDSLTGAVTLSTDPDYEAQSQYSFTVVASDGVNEAVEQSVTLDINNLDEIAPSITSGDTAVAINENSGASQVIYTATATDDADISAGVTFSLTGDSDSDPALSIDSLTGAVTLSTDPDYEAQSQYSFTVVASDGVNEAVEQLVTLDINNLDDTAPIITSSNTAFFIDDNSGATQVVYAATADDSGDDVSDTPIIFTLAEGSDPALTIDSSTGEVTLSTDPDHEEQSQYNFAVIATDAAGNESAAKSVTLEILDNSVSDTNILLDMTAPFSSDPNTVTQPTVSISDMGDTVFNIPAIHFANEQNPDAYGGFAHNTLTSGFKLYNWEGAEAGQAYLDAVEADAAAAESFKTAEDELNEAKEQGIDATAISEAQVKVDAAAILAKDAAKVLRDAVYFTNNLTFGSGGYIYFKGSVPSGGDASLIFMIFHYQVDPITGDFVTTLDENGNPSFILVDNQSFTTDPITIKGSEESYYAVKIDSTGKQGNMITMFFSPPDTDVMISDVRVITTPARDEMVRGPYFFNNVFSGGPVGDDPATEEIETYMPLGIDGNLLGSDNALPPIEITNEGTTFMVPSVYFEDSDADGDIDNPGAYSGISLDYAATPDLNSRPLTFGEGGKVTFMASVESGSADVRFRFEKIATEVFLDQEPSCTIGLLTPISGSTLTEYTVVVPPQAKRTFEYMVMYIDTPDTEVTLSNVLIETSPVDPTAVPIDCGSNAALYGDKELDMTAPFGDATIDTVTDNQGESLTVFRVKSEDAIDIDKGSDPGFKGYGGYAIKRPFPDQPPNDTDNGTLLEIGPAAFGAGGKITFTASIPVLQRIPGIDDDGKSITVDLANAQTSVDVKFRLERLVDEQNRSCLTEPAYDTEVITISGPEQEYSIDIPPQGFNTFQSFIMTIETLNTQVQISNIILTTTPPTEGVFVFPENCLRPKLLPSEYFKSPITATDFDGDGISNDMDTDTDGDGTPDVQEDDPLTDEIEVSDDYNYTIGVGGYTATFSGVYGKTTPGTSDTLQSGDQFTFPSNSADYGGWANGNTSLNLQFNSPSRFGTPRIAFCASAPLPAEGETNPPAVEVYFKFENEAWPNNSEQVLTTSAVVPRDGAMRAYLVELTDWTNVSETKEIDSVDSYSQFEILLMYIDQRDIEVTIGKIYGNWNNWADTDFWGEREFVTRVDRDRSSPTFSQLVDFETSNTLAYQTQQELIDGNYCSDFPVADTDGDGIKDNRDLYPNDPDRAQDIDMDGDGFDDLLDGDIDGDGVINVIDASPYDPVRQ